MKSKRKILIIGVFLIFIIFIIYLNYPRQLIIDVNETESITMKLKDETSNYILKITDEETINEVTKVLSSITYKKSTYRSDITALGMTGYELEVVYKNGKIKIIKIYYDDSIRIQSNGRYKTEEGMSKKIYMELFNIYNTILNWEHKYEYEYFFELSYDSPILVNHLLAIPI